MPDPRPSTIYVSGETVAEARTIERITGIKVGRLFRQFVSRYAQSLKTGKKHSINSVAFLLPGYEPWELYSPRPFLPPSDDSNRGVDIWAEAFSGNQAPAERVFLMGKSLANPLWNHEDLWVDFVSRGGHLQVLLQGDLSAGTEETPRLFASIGAARNQVKAAARDRSIEVLRRLSSGPGTPSVEVRNSGQILLSSNASLIFREDGSLDIYVAFGFGELSGRRPIVALTTATHSPPDETCELVARPLESLWLASVPEPGFLEPNVGLKSTVRSPNGANGRKAVHPTG